MRTALLVGNVQDFVGEAQRDPFLYSRNRLNRQLDLNVKYVQAETFSEIEQACQKNSSDVVFFLHGCLEAPENVAKSLEKIRTDHPDRKLIFIDPFAQASTWYFNVLPYVDKFLKRQIYHNFDDYKQDFIGGSRLTEFMATHWKIDLDKWYVGSEIPHGYEDRLGLGWNLGTAKTFVQGLQKPFLSLCPAPKKTIDLFCRMSLGHEHKKEWYYEYRKIALQAIEPLKSKYNVASGGGSIQKGLVSKRQYAREMKRSKIVFSPFGWGESCWRDFETVCSDCLLIKPSMSHLKTEPNIFIEGETYVPVRWDFADLEEKCTYYLENPDEAERIVKNARRAYANYFEQNRFLQTIEQVLAA